MMIFLLLVPLLALGSALLVYRFTGRLQLLKLDLVQFMYMFVISPVLFVWLKTFLYFLVKRELGMTLSPSDLLIIDTVFSTLFLYVYAFVVMHSVTKTFNLKMSQDPLYDLFHHSEYIHLWLTHLVMFIGTMGFLTSFALFNIAVPLSFVLNKEAFYALCASAIGGGLFTFLSVLTSDPRQENANFMRIMKLAFGIYFMIHVAIFFIFDPSFSAEYAIYWWSLFLFATTVTCSLFVYRSPRARSFMQRLSDRLKHSEWDFRAQLFTKK